MRQGYSITLVSLLFMLCSTSLKAESVVLSLPGDSQIRVSANYRPGDPNRPAILMQHGFLQTANFSTINALFGSLFDEGYTVLAPTLSLGIDQRKQSLPCEALHMHSLQDDVRELDFWSHWLIEQGHRRVVLLGHSAGSVQVLAYAAGELPPEVEGVVLLSLTYFGQGKASMEREEDVERAQRLQQQGSKTMEEFGLAFCRRYVTQPESYLSYIAWNRTHTLDELAKVKVPVNIIIGGLDSRIDLEWIDKLGEQGAQIHVIEKAGHFFDAEHEFDLLSEVELVLQQIGE